MSSSFNTLGVNIGIYGKSVILFFCWHLKESTSTEYPEFFLYFKGSTYIHIYIYISFDTSFIALVDFEQSRKYSGGGENCSVFTEELRSVWLQTLKLNQLLNSKSLPLTSHPRHHTISIKHFVRCSPDTPVTSDSKKTCTCHNNDSFSNTSLYNKKKYSCIHYLHFKYLRFFILTYCFLFVHCTVCLMSFLQEKYFSLQLISWRIPNTLKLETWHATRRYIGSFLPVCLEKSHTDHLNLNGLQTK